MSTRDNSNLLSVEYSSDTTIPANKYRQYFMITCTSGNATVSFGSGNGAVPLDSVARTFYEPYMCPNSEINITVTSGSSVVVVSDDV